jgi:hypothetical protein
MIVSCEGHIAHKGNTRNAYKVLNGSLERLGRKLVDNKFTLRDAECEVVEWIHLLQERVREQAFVNSVMDLRVLRKAGHFWIDSTSIIFSSNLHLNNRDTRTEKYTHQKIISLTISDCIMNLQVTKRFVNGKINEYLFLYLEEWQAPM